MIVGYVLCGSAALLLFLICLTRVCDTAGSLASRSTL